MSLGDGKVADILLSQRQLLFTSSCHIPLLAWEQGVWLPWRPVSRSTGV